MTKNQIRSLANSLLNHAERAVREAATCTDTNQSSWIVNMTASTIFAGLAGALLDLRNVPEEAQDDEEDKIHRLRI